MIFGVVGELDDNLEQFMQATDNRLKNNNMLVNPFRGKIISFNLNTTTKELKTGYAIYIKPLYFNFSYYGWLMALGVYLIWGISWFMLPGIIIGALGIFWSKFFYYIMLKLGAKKSGYNGELKFISAEKILKIWHFG